MKYNFFFKFKIFISYGDHDNVFFLFWYAFTVEENPEKIKEYPIEFDDGKLMKFNYDYDLCDIIVQYFELKKVEDFVTRNLIKDNIKIKKIFVIQKKIRKI